MSRPSLVCVDLGFLYNKALVNGRPFLCKSVVGNGKKLRFEDLRLGNSDNNEDRMVAKLRGNEYFVSDLAIKQSDIIEYSLKPDRFNTDVARVLIDTVYARGLGSGLHTAYIVSGLPVSHYAKYKEDIKQLFVGVGQMQHSYDVTINETSIRGQVLAVDARFIPQPFGVYLDTILDDDGSISRKDLALKTGAVIDVGFGTTDVYAVNSLEPIESLTFSTNTAMNHAYSLISNKIEEHFGILLPLYKVERIVRSGEFITHGKLHDMRQVIALAFQSTARQLVSEIFNKWRNSWEIDFILVAGGGGQILSKHILPEFQNITLVNNPQWSVVNGYYKWGRRTWKDVETVCIQDYAKNEMVRG